MTTITVVTQTLYYVNYVVGFWSPFSVTWKGFLDTVSLTTHPSLRPQGDIPKKCRIGFYPLLEFPVTDNSSEFLVARCFAMVMKH